MIKSLNLRYEKRAKIFLIFALLIILVVGGWVFFGEHNPQFSPLNNRNETYEVTKNTENIYSITYSGKSDYGITSATIAKSPINLEPFIGEKVSLSGRFARTTTQCIADICKNIGVPFIGLYIDNITKSPTNFVNQQPRDKIISYVVENGDVIQLIANKFGISVNTIKWENNLNSDTVFPGQSLKILPVTGVSHIVEKGDTLDSLAQKYHTTKQKIIDYPFNNYANPEKFTLIPGEILIIPAGIK